MNLKLKTKSPISRLPKMSVARVNRPYTVIIPTKGRYNKVKPLASLGLPRECFVLCVNDESEAEKYANANPGVEILISHKKGCMPNRNFLLDYYPVGSKIIMVDDDVEGLFEQRGPGRQGLVKMTGDEIDNLIKKGFAMCETNGTKLWGVYPTFNHYFMSRTIVPHGFIVGMWMGIIVSDERFDTNVKFKDDYAFTCQHIIRFKKIVRFNYVCVKAQYLTNAGGSADFRTAEAIEKDVEYLIQKYPNFIQRNNKRKGNEILLKFRPVKGA